MEKQERPRSSGVRRLSGLARSVAAITTLGLMCLAPVSAFADDKLKCSNVKLELPDAQTQHLSDGEHVIASAETVNGKLEARVIVKKGVASEPAYYLGGRQLKETSPSKINEPLLKCLSEGLDCGTKNAEGVCTEDWLSTAVDGILDAIVPPAEAVYPSMCYVMSSGCYEGLGCCAEACCVRKGRIGCSHWCTSYEK